MSMMNPQRSAYVRFLFRLAGKEDPLSVKVISAHESLHGVSGPLFELILAVLRLSEEEFAEVDIANLLDEAVSGWAPQTRAKLSENPRNQLQSMGGLPPDPAPLPSLRELVEDRRIQLDQLATEMSNEFRTVRLRPSAFEFPAAKPAWQEVLAHAGAKCLFQIYTSLPPDAVRRILVDRGFDYRGVERDSEVWIYRDSPEVTSRVRIDNPSGGGDSGLYSDRSVHFHKEVQAAGAEEAIRLTDRGRTRVPDTRAAAGRRTGFGDRSHIIAKKVGDGSGGKRFRSDRGKPGPPCR